MKKKRKSHTEDFVMGKKNRFANDIVAGADETFFVVVMDNGKSSPALNAKQEILDWLDEHFVNTENNVSHISVNRKKRKSALLREAERQSEITQLKKRLSFLEEQPAPLILSGKGAL